MVKNAKKKMKKSYKKPAIKKYDINSLKKGWDYETFGISIECTSCPCD